MYGLRSEAGLWELALCRASPSTYSIPTARAGMPHLPKTMLSLSLIQLACLGCSLDLLVVYFPALARHRSIHLLIYEAFFGLCRGSQN